MENSLNPLTPLFLQLHKAIEAAADQTATRLAQHALSDFIHYPPNGGLNAAETESLQGLEIDEHRHSALRKLIANACASVVFDLLATIDGVSDPEVDPHLWKGVDLAARNREGESPDIMLHDQLYESYWQWRERRENNRWKLDTLPN